MTKKKMNFQKNKKKNKSTSFGRNLLEADDMPVLDIDTAVEHLRMGLHKNELEKQVDDYFLKYLPKDIIDPDGLEELAKKENVIKNKAMANK